MVYGFRDPLIASRFPAAFLKQLLETVSRDELCFWHLSQFLFPRDMILQRLNGNVWAMHSRVDRR